MAEVSQSAQLVCENPLAYYIKSKSEGWLRPSKEEKNRKFFFTQLGRFHAVQVFAGHQFANDSQETKFRLELEAEEWSFL